MVSKLSREGSYRKGLEVFEALPAVGLVCPSPRLECGANIVAPVQIHMSVFTSGSQSLSGPSRTACMFIALCIGDCLRRLTSAKVADTAITNAAISALDKGERRQIVAVCKHVTIQTYRARLKDMFSAALLLHVACCTRPCGCYSLRWLRMPACSLRNVSLHAPFSQAVSGSRPSPSSKVRLNQCFMLHARVPA